MWVSELEIYEVLMREWKCLNQHLGRCSATDHDRLSDVTMINEPGTGGRKIIVKTIVKEFKQPRWVDLQARHRSHQKDDQQW